MMLSSPISSEQGQSTYHPIAGFSEISARPGWNSARVCPHTLYTETIYLLIKFGGSLMPFSS